MPNVARIELKSLAYIVKKARELQKIVFSHFFFPTLDLAYFIFNNYD